MRRAIVLGALACAVLLASVEARATTAIQLTPEEQVADARAICLGRCTKIETRNVDGNIYTYISLDVREVLKGDVAHGRLVLKQVGGEVGGLGEWISGSPRFDVGRDSLVFLDTNADGAYVVAGLFMGNFSLEKGADGRDWIRRDTGGDGAHVLKRPGGADDPLALMPLDDLRATVVRAAAKSATVYDRAAQQIPVEYTRYFEGPSSVLPSFVLFNNQRWFEPDNGETVKFYCNPTNFDPQGGSIPDLPAAVQDALAAWSAIPSCSFRYEYMGIDTNGCGWTDRERDHIARVSIDCRGEVAGEGCRSIIAIGGGHYDTTQSVVVNGTTFRRIYDADVCLQDGWCDYFQNPVSLREVITHELGHCLGLGHSADHTATMSGYIHNDGRGATVMPDDQAGAQFIYPGAPGGGDDGGGGGNTEPDPPVISTSSLPEGTVGVSYSSVFAVVNGKDPFEWSLTSGTLPTGVALAPNGTLAGVPTLAGSYSFSVRVLDSLGRIDGKFLSVTIRVPPPAVVAAAFRNPKRELTLVGSNFAEGAQFEVNGQLLAPRKPPLYNAAAGTYVIKGSRKQLHINKGVGTNLVVVIVAGERSQPFAF